MARIKIITIAILTVVFVIVGSARIKGTGSDPRGTLLVSEAILNHGSIKLDPYGADVLQSYGYTVQNKNGHFYYYFPLGTSIASLPFVAAANLFGLNMQRHERALQIAIAALTSVLTLLLLIKLARIFLTPGNALLIGSVFWFGTSLASTTGTALWSHNFATLFALAAIYLTIKATRDQRVRLWPLISVALFAAYLCRPTMALLAPFLLLYFFTYQRLAAAQAALLLTACLAGFAGFSSYEFGQVLPDYYLPKRLDGSHFSEALYGNLFSPARGFLVYSPFVLLAWLCIRAPGNFDLKKSWLLIGLAWPVLHLILISRFEHWWGGHSFGARFMTDVLPGLFLLTLYTWPATLKGTRDKAAAAVLALAAAFAIFVNTGQGLYNRYTAYWNGTPNIDQYPEYLFDWRYPQFLAHKKGHEERLARHAAAHPPRAASQ